LSSECEKGKKSKEEEEEEKKKGWLAKEFKRQHKQGRAVTSILTNNIKQDTAG
jgi:hypothetical protein